MGRTDLPTLFNSHDFEHNEDVTEYTVTALAGGAAANLAGVPNGVLRCAGAAATASSGVNAQVESTPIRLERQDSFASLEIRLRVNDLKQALFFGLSDTNANLLAALVNALGIQKAGGAGGQWTFRHVRASTGSNVTKNLGPLISDTNWHTITIFVDCSQGSTLGGGNVKIAVDGVQVSDNDLTQSVPFDVNLTPSFAFASGDAVGTQSVDVDYVMFTSTRSRL